MMCAVVVRRLKPGAYDAFRQAWEPLSDDEWPARDDAAVDRPCRGRLGRGGNVGPVRARRRGLEAMRDDPAWMAAESRRMERMAPHQEELVISSYFHVAEEVVPPAARSSRGDA